MDTAIYSPWFDSKVREYKSKMRGFEEGADSAARGMERGLSRGRAKYGA
jgi:hypothetical protein